MEIEGKVIQDLGLQTGTSKAGNPWKKKEIIIETFGNYPKRVKLTMFGDRADSVGAEVGQSYSFSIDIESREWQGRWFTDVNAFSSRLLGAPEAQGMPQTFPQQPQYAAPQQPFAPQPAAPATPADPFGSNDSDDLPF